MYQERETRPRADGKSRLLSPQSGVVTQGAEGIAGIEKHVTNPKSHERWPQLPSRCPSPSSGDPPPPAPLGPHRIARPIPLRPRRKSATCPPAYVCYAIEKGLGSRLPARPAAASATCSPPRSAHRASDHGPRPRLPGGPVHRGRAPGRARKRATSLRAPSGAVPGADDRPRRSESQPAVQVCPCRQHTCASQ